MPKIFGKRKATGESSVLGAHASSVDQQGVDRALQRIANASQLGVLVLAVFGYFYTVLPVYQKSLLDEEIAKKTLELQSMEKRVEAAESTLISRESELAEMNKKISTLSSTAQAARAGLGRAQMEVGRLKSAVDIQYAELLPRLIQEFKGRALRECKTSATSELGFAACIETRGIVPSQLVPEDRARLNRHVRERSPSIYKSWTDFSGNIERRKQEVEFKKREAQAQCNDKKASDDYKDRLKKISIDHQCAIDMNAAASDSIKITIDEMFSGDKAVLPTISSIADSFFNGR